MTQSKLFRRYLLPGLLFQSVVIAGGYGTGRELVEFFLTQGPMGGLLALFGSMVVFSAVSMATYELARIWGAFDYRHFFKELLDKEQRLREEMSVALQAEESVKDEDTDEEPDSSGEAT